AFAQTADEGQRELADVAAGRGAMPFELAKQRRQLLRPQRCGVDAAERMPAITVPCGAQDRRRAVAANPDRRMRPLHRLRLGAQRGEAVVAPGMLDRAL